MLMEKRGEVVSDSAIELIIAVAVVAVLIIFVVSFGDVEGEEYFNNKKIGDNVICVCYWDGEDEQNYCRECLDLSMSARSIVGSVHSIDASDLSSGTWEIVEGGRVEIWKDGGGYVFSTK